MTVLLEKRRLIVSPGLVPAQMRREDKFGHPQNVDVDLTIGLINNMPDAALQATERQFMRLLRQAAGDIRIDFHCFSLPSVRRSQPAKGRVEGQYTDIAEIDRLHIDGLIVTGAEPNAATLRQARRSGASSPKSSTGQRTIPGPRSGRASPPMPRCCIWTASNATGSKRSAPASMTASRPTRTG